jgi:hypothetical protein
MFRNISRHFGAITDTRVISDPWGLGLQLEVIRSEHSSWTTWKAEHGLAGDDFEKEMLRAQVRRSLEPPAGARLKKGGVAAGSGAIVDQTVERMHAKLRAVHQDATLLERIKEGLATVAIRRVVAGLVEGVAACTACGNRFQPEHGDDPCPAEACGAREWEIAEEREVPDNVEARRRLLSNPRDRDGNPLWVPATRKVVKANPETGLEEEVEETTPFGGQAVGDAIAAWILSEMEEQEKFRKDYVENALGNSVPAPASSPASGTP